MKKPIYKRWWFWLIIIIVAFAIASRGKDEPQNISQNITKQVTEKPTEQSTLADEPGDVEKTDKSEGKVEEQAVEPVITDKVSEDVKAKETTETLSQKNAIKKAEQYIKLMAFSESGLIDQLEFEGFSNEDATYAVNKLNVDWKEQAKKS